MKTATFDVDLGKIALQVELPEGFEQLPKNERQKIADKLIKDALQSRFISPYETEQIFDVESDLLSLEDQPHD